MRWTVRLLALVALAVTSYLGWVSFNQGQTVFGCGGLPQFDCDHVLRSRWSSWLGMPVSVAAVAVYGLILAASLSIGPNAPPAVRRVARGALILLTTLAASAALWFLALLATVTDSLCLFCMIVHACGLTIAALTLVRIPKRSAAGSAPPQLAALGVKSNAVSQRPRHDRDSTAFRPRGTGLLVSLGLAGTGLLIAGQVMFPPKMYSEGSLADAGRNTSAPGAAAPPVEPDVAPPAAPSTQPTAELPSRAGMPASPQPAIVDGRIVLDTRAHPIVGDPRAKYVIVKLFDYSCKHCRTLDHYLEQARRRYGPQLAVVNLPVPLNADCNKFVPGTQPDHQSSCFQARLALAVWRLDASKFETFHKWMLEPERPPLVSEAKNFAAELVGWKELNEERKSPEVEQTVENYTRLFKRCGRGTLPIMLLDTHIVRGEANSAEEIFELLEKLCDIRQPAP